MTLPALLYNYFNQGRENLEMSSALLNPYAKYMQSPNIPRNTKLPIAIDMIESTIENDPTVEEWFNQLESNTRKTQLPVPLFFPRVYHDTNRFYSTEFKGEDRWVNAVVSANDKLFSMYSESLKKDSIRVFLNRVTTEFPKLFNASLFRPYKTRKNQIYSALFKDTTAAALHVYSMVLNKNILVKHELGYEWCSNVYQDRDTLCFWELNGTVGLITDTESPGHVDVDFILESNIDLFSDRTKKIKVASNPETLEKSRELSKKKITELRNNANEKGFEGNKLTKEELVDRLLADFMVPQE